MANPYLISPAAAAFFASGRCSIGLVHLELNKERERQEYRRMMYGRPRPRLLSVTVQRTPYLGRGGRLGGRIAHCAVWVRQRVGDPRLFLRCVTQEFYYSEFSNGTANLALFGERLPETICAGLSGGHMRLSEIVDTTRFFRAGDPPVSRVSNGKRLRRPALVFRLQLSFNPYVSRRAPTLTASV